MSDPVGQIKSSIALESVVAEVVALKGAGKGRLKGLCPFHAEKTPSFHVIQDRGYFYCFGCQAKGDVFDFIMRTQGLEFRDALEQLAGQAGIVLPERRERTRDRDLYDLQTLAQEYFLQGLKDHPEAQSYLKGRGLSDETIQAWGLGYAPDGWHGLIAHARRKGVEPEALERAGLAKSRDGRPYDVFRGRVTIPIRDAYSRTVGFSGRILGEGEPKYLNTPETDIFKKGDMLFGLPNAKAAIRKSRAAILVEGQFDVIALHQAGFTAAVGAQSATLTPAQIATLDRLGVSTLYPAYDSDSAGQRATLAALDAVARSFLCKVVRLPGKDPAETVQEDPDAFRQALRRAVPEVRYRLEQALVGLDLSNQADKQAALDRLKAGLCDMREPFDPVAGELRRLTAEVLDIDLDALRKWVKGSKKVSPIQPPLRQPSGDPVQSARLKIVALTLYDAELTPQLLGKVEHVGDDVLRRVSAAWRAHPDDLARTLETFSDGDRNTIYSTLAHDLTNIEKAFDIGLRQFQFLVGDAAPNELHVYLDSFPGGYTAADKRTCALADYAARLPDDEQSAAFAKLVDTTLNGEPIDAATESDLLTDALALHLSVGAGDPKQHLDVARNALRRYRPSGVPSDYKAA